MPKCEFVPSVEGNSSRLGAVADPRFIARASAAGTNSTAIAEIDLMFSTARSAAKKCHRLRAIAPASIADRVAVLKAGAAATPWLRSFVIGVARQFGVRLLALRTPNEIIFALRLARASG